MKAKFPLVNALMVGLLAFLFFRYVGKPNLFTELSKREGMVNKKCPDGTRSDGPCLLEFPTS